MTWHLYFRNNSDMTLGCICYNIFDLILRIKSSVANVVVTRSWIVTYDCAVTISADFSQLRIFFYFHSPALVVCKVPVKSVHLMKRNEVDILLYEVNIKKMTCNIEHQAAVLQSRLIIDTHKRNL